jgi:hypothetical protein
VFTTLRSVDDRSWEFEEADDDGYLERLTGHPVAPTEIPRDALTAHDPDQVIAIVVSPQAELIAVRLSPQWRQSVEPRNLHSSVVSAANAATVRALAQNAEGFDLATMAEADESVNRADESASGTDDSHLTTQDVQRLLDDVSAELGRFTEQLSAMVDHPVQVQSAGRHVQGSALRGQVLQLDIDTGWAGRARHTEIEGELLEVLRRLQESSTPRDLATGPTGRAISELMEMARDPQLLMRRLGMPE